MLFQSRSLATAVSLAPHFLIWANIMKTQEVPSSEMLVVTYQATRCQKTTVLIFTAMKTTKICLAVLLSRQSDGLQIGRPRIPRGAVINALSSRRHILDSTFSHPLPQETREPECWEKREKGAREIDHSWTSCRQDIRLLLAFRMRQRWEASLNAWPNQWSRNRQEKLTVAQPVEKFLTQFHYHVNKSPTNKQYGSNGNATVLYSGARFESRPVHYYPEGFRAFFSVPSGERRTVTWNSSLSIPSKSHRIQCLLSIFPFDII
jgi:hypothetical protein